MNKFKKLLLSILALTITAIASAQTLDEVIGKYIAALGGAAKLKALQSVKMVGMLTTPQGLDVGITTTILNGVGFRSDISIPQAGKGYQIITPTKGWNLMPGALGDGVQKMEPEQVKSGQATIDLQGGLMNYRSKGHQVSLQGKEMADTVECYKIKILYKTGKLAYFYIDTKNFYRVKMVVTETTNGTPVEMAISYSDFRRTPEGYLFAYTQKGPNGTLQFSAVTVNKPVNADIFKVN
jgi:hypothetical protein